MPLAGETALRFHFSPCRGELNLSRKWYFQKFLQVEGMVAGGGGSDSLSAGEGTVP